ncbi:hypothetical protein LCGC14_1392830 [marine sediment metagenome]|uniref:Uncharacterized protein n=1 Tax=marine sediment metagenome TaxID=412755 RepID=A0A0F9JZK5_9ZZZZ
MDKHNSGQWTKARFISFIRGGLRSISMRWPPKYEVKKAARISRGIYMCAGYNRGEHEVVASLPPKPGNKRRINNAVVDHINPVIDPVLGFRSWDSFIERLFCEVDGFQVLCDDCHKNKTADERKKR